MPFFFDMKLCKMLSYLILQGLTASLIAATCDWLKIVVSSKKHHLFVSLIELTYKNLTDKRMIKEYA